MLNSHFLRVTKGGRHLPGDLPGEDHGLAEPTRHFGGWPLEAQGSAQDGGQAQEAHGRQRQPQSGGGSERDFEAAGAVVSGRQGPQGNFM